MGTKVIPREARRITYSTEIRNLKKTLILSEYQKAFVIGTILGDGYLDPNWSKTNYRLKISHSIKQKEYFSWKYDILKDWILTEPMEYTRTHSITLRTVSHPEFTVLQNLFYQGRRKIIPHPIEKFLRDPVTIAVWFMDDGNAVKRNGKTVGYHLNTQSFTQSENLELLHVLGRIHGIRGVLERNNGKFRIGIWNKSSREKFSMLIAPHLIASMRYKIG